MEAIIFDATDSSRRSTPQYKWKRAERCGDCQRQNFQLVQGIKAGNVGLVTEILNRGLDPDMIFEEGKSVELLIAIAVTDGPFEMTSLLLQHGASPNGSGLLVQTIPEYVSPLAWSQLRNRIDIEMLLRDYGGKLHVSEPDTSDDICPLFKALLVDDFKHAERLILAGISPNKLLEIYPFTLLRMPGRNFNFVQAICEHFGRHQLSPLKSIITKLQRKWLLSDQDISFLRGFVHSTYYTLLNSLIFGGLFSAAQFLLENGAKVQAEPSQLQPLHAAIDMNNIEIVEELLTRGAPINIKNERGLSYLHLACRCASDDIACSLLEAGATVEAMDELGLTSLLHACHYGNQKVVRLLLKAKASVNCFNSTSKNSSTSTIPPWKEFKKYSEESWTALCIAAHRGYTRIVRLLLQCGALVSLSTTDGKTALDLAIASSHFDVALLLLKKNSPFFEKYPETRTLLKQAVDGCQTELAELLIRRGVQYTTAGNSQIGFGEPFTNPVPKPFPDSSIKSLNLVRSNNSMSLLSGEMESLFTEDDDGDNGNSENENEEKETQKPTICTRCSKYFHRIGGLCSLPFPITYEPDLGCKFCQLVSESIPTNSVSGQEVKVQFFPPMTEAWERPYLDVFGGKKSAKHMIRQVSG